MGDGLEVYRTGFVCRRLGLDLIVSQGPHPPLHFQEQSLSLLLGVASTLSQLW